jgi:hypothetical protein
MAFLQRSLTLAPIEAAMESRYNRGNLEKGVAYIQVNRGTRTPVGKFVEAARYGSGDGMELVLVFEHLGRRNIVKEDMWGSTSGAELSYFVRDTAKTD